VNSYAYEDAVKTTLLEGSVQIIPLQEPKKKTILKPGEQAIVSKQFLKILPVDVEVATAWKNGNFLFRNEQLESILNRLAYWYDVEIVYRGKKPDMLMSGMIERKRKLSSVLNLIESTGRVKFKVEGRKVYVMN
jgi:transmembrane sensor